MRLERRVSHLGAVEPVLTDEVRPGKPRFHVAEVVVILLFDVARPLVMNEVRLGKH